MARIQIAVCLSLKNTFTRDVFRGFAEFAATQRDWQLRTFEGRDVLAAGFARVHRIGGVLLDEPDATRLAKARRLRVPTVNVSNSDDPLLVPTAMSDDQAVGGMAGEYFSGRGWRNFGFCGNRDRASARDRLAGLQAAAARLPTKVHALWWAGDPTREAEDDRRLLAWLRALPKPAGVLAATDRIASRLVALCARAGIAVPDELGIVGVGHDEIMQSLSQLEITSVALGTHRIGRTAGEILAALLRQRDPGPLPRRIPPQRLIEGRSSSTIAVNDPTINRAVDYMRTHLHRSFGMEAVAAAAGLSRRGLERRFESELGIAPYEQLMRLRLERARHLIATTTDPLDSVARAIGLSDGSHLSVFFKARTGEPPRVFRLRCQT